MGVATEGTGKMITAKKIRIFALSQWTVGIMLALIFNRIWPPAAILFCLLTMTAPILGFAAPVINRMNNRNDPFIHNSAIDFILYLILLVLPPIIDIITQGLLCPPKFAYGVWFASIVVVLFMLPGKWYDRYRELEKKTQKNALEALKKKETFFSILRVAFIGGVEYFETMSSRRRWIYVISLGATMVAVMGTTWIAVMAQTVQWLPIFAIPFAFIGIFAAFSATGVTNLEMIDKVALQNELNTAHDMQMGLMPMSDPDIEGYEISGKCFPANEVGGDYFDYLWMNEGKTKFGIAIADVSGNAMKAAITAVMTSGMIYREIGKDQSPKEILTNINTPIYLKTTKSTFTAMSIAVIDTEKKTLTLSNAGQTQPILKRSGETRFLKVEGNRFPLGIVERVTYDEMTIGLQPDDLIVFYTDGLVEETNSQKELYGFERLEQKIHTLGQETSKEIIETVIKEVESFTGSDKPHDDMTVVVVKVL